MPKPHYITSQPIELEIQGKVHRGRYTVDKGIVTVESDFGEQSAMLSRGSNAEVSAGIMLRDLVDKRPGTKPTQR